MERNYYVYVYYRLDTNEPFYVGKGKDNRYKVLDSRGSHFTNIANSTPIAVEIVCDSLTEEQALGIECYLIHELVFEYGFSIDIEGNRGTDKDYCHLVNATWGGEGTSGYKHTEEQREKMSENHWDCNGENNPQYGKRGELSPNFGKPRSEETRQRIGEANKGKNHSEETRQKLSEANKGKNHPQAILYKVINSNDKIIGILCGNEIYNHNSKGFLNISQNSFNKYIKPFGNIDISRLQGNHSSIKALREKLTPYNGWQFIEISKEELETEVA